MDEMLLISKEKLNQIADAIRTRTGMNGEMTLDEMINTIKSLPMKDLILEIVENGFVPISLDSMTIADMSEEFAVSTSAPSKSQINEVFTAIALSKISIPSFTTSVSATTE